MTLIPNPTVCSALVGGLCLLGCVFLSAREVLLSPVSPNYPPAPLWLRLLMANWAAFLLLRGSDLLFSLTTTHPQIVAPSALGAAAMQTAALGGMLLYTMRQRLPASFYRRMARAIDLTHCHKQARVRAAALQILQFEGVPIALPGEMPGDVPGLGKDLVMH
jgi:hypothetical protein